MPVRNDIAGAAPPAADESAEATWVELCDALEDPAWILRGDGSATYVNDAFLAHTGVVRDEAQGFAWLSAVRPDGASATLSYWAAGFAGARPFDAELDLRRADGRYGRFRARAVPLRDGRGRWFVTARPRGADDAERASAVVNRVPRARDAAERETADAQVRLRLALGAARTGIWEWLVESGEVFWSPESYAIVGARDDQFDKTLEGFRRLVHPDDAAGLWAAVERALRGEAELDVEFRVARSDGAVRWLHNHALVERDATGRPVRVLGTVRDVTEQRLAHDARRASEEQARARAEELATLMDAAPAAIWIAHDRACAQVTGSRGGYEVLRTPTERNLSKSAEDSAAVAHFAVYREGRELAPHELPLQLAAREGVEVRDFEEELRFADGSRAQLYGNAVPLRDASGAPRGAIAAFIDVTRLKATEAALRDADQRKDDFLAVLSHELRNPLASIVAAAQLMKVRGEAPAARERAVIERQTLHLMRLVDDLLDHTRLSRGALELQRERVELARVVAHAVETTAPAVEKKGHALAIDVPPDGLAVDGDPVRLAQVVANLLTNAARYTPAGGAITVSASREGAEVVLRVRDTGVGIAPEFLPRMFELLASGGPRPDRAEGGLGLGLGIVRRVMALHGGTARVQSEGPGRGSEFELRLPAV